MEVYWTSHSGGPPPLWPATPNVTFSGTPSSEWDIYGIEATFDPTKTDFYVKVGMKQTSSSTTYMTNSPSTQHWTISATSWDNIDQP
jgi:hypothetical protein